MLDDRHQALTKFYGHLVELFLAFVNFGLCRIVLYLIFLNDGRAIPTSQMMREEAQEAFRAWEEKEDKVEY